MPTNAPETMGVIYRLQLSQLHPHPQNPSRTVTPSWKIQKPKASPMINGWEIKRSLPTGNEYASPLMIPWRKIRRASMLCWNFSIRPGMKSNKVRFLPSVGQNKETIFGWTPLVPGIPQMSYGRSLLEPEPIHPENGLSWIRPQSQAAVC